MNVQETLAKNFIYECLMLALISHEIEIEGKNEQL